MFHNSFIESKQDPTQNIEKDENSNFDTVLKEKWMLAQTNGVFRYVLNIQDSKILNGKYEFLAQLNIDRGCKRRSPETITSMKQPFDDKHFNFTKLKLEEEIMNISSSNEEDIIAINVSPLEFYHSLFLPQRCKQLPQVVTKYSLLQAIKLFSLSSSLYFRVCLNSLCAHASVNHLHWHLYYLNQRMLLEYIDLEEYAGPVQILEKYPAKGFCIKYSSVQNMNDFVDWSFLIINYLQNAQIAHNVYITRASSNIKEECKDLRIYIWARKHAGGIKNIDAFNPAACELFGHLTITSEETYKNLKEEYVVDVLRDVTEEPFYSVLADIKSLIENRINQ